MDTVWYQNSEQVQSNIRAFQPPKITNYRFQRKKKVYQHKWEKDCWNHIHQKIPGYLRRCQQRHLLLHSHPGCPSLLSQLNLNPAFSTEEMTGDCLIILRGKCFIILFATMFNLSQSLELSSYICPHVVLLQLSFSQNMPSNVSVNLMPDLPWIP